MGSRTRWKRKYRTDDCTQLCQCCSGNHGASIPVLLLGPPRPVLCAVWCGLSSNNCQLHLALQWLWPALKDQNWQKDGSDKGFCTEIRSIKRTKGTIHWTLEHVISPQCFRRTQLNCWEPPWVGECFPHTHKVQQTDHAKGWHSAAGILGFVIPEQPNPIYGSKTSGVPPPNK